MDCKSIRIILNYILTCETVPDSLFVHLSSLLAHLTAEDVTDGLVLQLNLIKFYSSGLLTCRLLSDAACFNLLLPLLKIIYQQDQPAYKTS